MAEGDQTTDTQARELLDLMKENTSALHDLKRVMGALIISITGAPASEREPDGVAGLLERLTENEEATSQLDTRLIGLAINISKWTFVGDHLTRIRSGDPSAEPPVPGRELTVNDMADALLEYEKKIEEEEKLAEEEEKAEEKREAEEDAAAAAEDAGEPKKPAMLSNAPGLKALPPLPVAAPKPD